MKIELIDEWDDDINGTEDRYYEFRLGANEVCCVKYREDGLRYVMECYDGNEIYSYADGTESPLRKITREEEDEVIELADNRHFKRRR